MPIGDWAIAVALGVLGAALHLSCTRARAGATVAGHMQLALLLFPLGLLGPAATLLLAAWLDPRLAWASGATLIVVHRCWLWLMSLRNPLTRSSRRLT